MRFICQVLTHPIMAIDPESFDEPVKDYDFANLTDTKSLIDQMAIAGGFTATKLAYARDCLLYTSPSPRDAESSRMPSSA